ncbi:DUF4293 family protein [Fulvivirga sp. RKSG066]|uniref:DUF4293 domain-containing protein n=1 Tax=Fulvivirga aurantia TaxID=2529383 RepID=UPI0012BCC01F|nr:DUF4293 domain-containing protein [Fulvivirga aurantia]MTI21946.1 DUF4293 family protein [Fulvivirga aurantia]
MLQRIQTVFLLLVVLLMGAHLLLPLWSFSSEDSEVYYKLFSYYFESNPGTEEASSTVYFPFATVACLAVASIVVTIIEISKFKNRLLQMKLGALNSIFMAGTMGLGVYFATDLMEVKQVVGSYGPGLFLPGAAMILNVIANRFIRKDERLVRSVDRIR